MTKAGMEIQNSSFLQKSSGLFFSRPKMSCPITSALFFPLCILQEIGSCFLYIELIQVHRSRQEFQIVISSLEFRVPVSRFGCFIFIPVTQPGGYCKSYSWRLFPLKSLPMTLAKLFRVGLAIPELGVMLWMLLIFVCYDVKVIAAIKLLL